jgi:hypothetical protein
MSKRFSKLGFNYYFFLGLFQYGFLAYPNAIKIRERTKTFRAFHGFIESANAIMKSYETFYNFIRKHQSIKKCPYELAIPELKLDSENKWMELIKMANE